MGLDKLHAITTSKNFGLKVIMGDYDGTDYHAIYDTFQVRYDLNQIDITDCYRLGQDLDISSQ